MLTEKLKFQGWAKLSEVTCFACNPVFGANAPSHQRGSRTCEGYIADEERGGDEHQLQHGLLLLSFSLFPDLHVFLFIRWHGHCGCNQDAEGHDPDRGNVEENHVADLLVQYVFVQAV